MTVNSSQLSRAQLLGMIGALRGSLYMVRLHATGHPPVCNLLEDDLDEVQRIFDATTMNVHEPIVDPLHPDQEGDGPQRRQAVVVKTDGYEWLFLDGKLMNCGDDLTEGQILHAFGREERSLISVLGADLTVVYTEDHDALEDHVQETGDVPPTFEELKKLMTGKHPEEEK